MVATYHNVVEHLNLAQMCYGIYGVIMSNLKKIQNSHFKSNKDLSSKHTDICLGGASKRWGKHVHGCSISQCEKESLVDCA